jgi:CTP:molybdopterin cytidylyltransferase MocA
MSGSEQRPSVCVVITAAGLSLRYPGKLLTDLDGQPALWHTLSVLAERIPALVLVLPDPVALGHADWAVRLHTQLSGLTGDSLKPGTDLRVVTNPDPARGLSSSLHLGLAAAPAVEYIGLCNGDRCFLKPDSVSRLVDALADTPDILLPVDRSRPEVPGHPVFFHRRTLPELLALSGDEGARSLLRHHAERITRLELDDTGLWRDLDEYLDRNLAGDPS